MFIMELSINCDIFINVFSIHSGTSVMEVKHHPLRIMCGCGHGEVK